MGTSEKRIRVSGTRHLVLGRAPLLANIYMNRFLNHWRMSGCDKAFCAHVVAYADDFVILSRDRAAAALRSFLAQTPTIRWPARLPNARRSRSWRAHD
jgi:retron-type reverse transcriptase